MSLNDSEKPDRKDYTPAKLVQFTQEQDGVAAESKGMSMKVYIVLAILAVGAAVAASRASTKTQRNDKNLQEVKEFKITPPEPNETPTQGGLFVAEKGNSGQQTNLSMDDLGLFHPPILGWEVFVKDGELHIAVQINPFEEEERHGNPLCETINPTHTRPCDGKYRGKDAIIFRAPPHIKDEIIAALDKACPEGECVEEAIFQEKPWVLELVEKIRGRCKTKPCSPEEFRVQTRAEIADIIARQLFEGSGMDWGMDQ
jgi:hypothetical protein